MTNQCPACGQDLRRCPICYTGVQRQYHQQRHQWVIKKHQDGINNDCHGAGLDYTHTVAPKGAA